MKTRFAASLVLAGLLATLSVPNAFAKEEGDWLFRFGASYADPKSNNHDVVSVDGAGALTFNISYMMTPNLSIELLAATPFEHDITLDDGTKVGSTKHLPPTLSLQYHFAPQSRFSPYLGLGLNYTKFFSEKTAGPLEGLPLDLSSSYGLAAEIGADIKLNDRWFLNLDARWISISTDATLDGGDLGTVKIDPLVYGAHVGLRF